MMIGYRDNEMLIRFYRNNSLWCQWQNGCRILFSEIKGGTNPIHFDRDVACGEGDRDRIVYGMHTLC